MNTVALPEITMLPSIGPGAWHMDASANHRTAEAAAVRLAT